MRYHKMDEFDIAKRDKHVNIVYSVSKTRVSTFQEKIRNDKWFILGGAFTFIGCEILDSVEETCDDNVFLKNPGGTRFSRISKTTVFPEPAEGDVLVIVCIKPEMEGLEFGSYTPENMFQNAPCCTFSIDHVDLGFKFERAGDGFDLLITTQNRDDIPLHVKEKLAKVSELMKIIVTDMINVVSSFYETTANTVTART